MAICPDCGHENIDGSDTCEACEQSLTPLSKPRPRTKLERSLLKGRISELEPREPLVVDPDATVMWVLKLLYDHRIGSAVVVDDAGKPIGIFTERDALMRLGPEAYALRDRPVSDFMTPAPTVLESTDRIAFALHRMDLGGYRHIPIVTDGLVSGVISVRDIMRYMNDRLMAGEMA
jgi:CBS domain-containing protein